MKKFKISIYRQPVGAVKHTLSILAIGPGLIFVGIALDSQAMQWFGFLFGSLAVIGLVMNHFDDNQRECASFSEARDIIAEFERREKAD